MISDSLQGYARTQSVSRGLIGEIDGRDDLMTRLDIGAVGKLKSIDRVQLEQKDRNTVPVHSLQGGQWHRKSPLGFGVTM
jgi:hypothetical protein